MNITTKEEKKAARTKKKTYTTEIYFVDIR